MKNNGLMNDNSRALLREGRLPRSELQIIDKPKKIISQSQAMQNIDDDINTVSSTNTTVLIIGESGIGKELLARTIHYRSRRMNRAFVKVDCAAWSESHTERELFGYEKGAIAGTTGGHQGSLTIADGGTLFLAEIGALSPLLQAKLLLVLKNREFEKIGGKRPAKVDVRIVAATAQDLERQMEAGRFNKDLYYELNVFPIIVPPLRERRQDIILLANHFIEKYARELGKASARLAFPTIDALMNYHWPGNVQELKGCIERALILSTDDIIHPHHLPLCLQSGGFTGPAKGKKT